MSLPSRKSKAEVDDAMSVAGLDHPLFDLHAAWLDQRDAQHG